MSFKVRQATPQDIEQIINICSGNLIKNKTGQNLEKSGFLLSEYTFLQWQETILNKHSLTLVYELKNEIIGYLNGFEITKAEDIVQKNILSLSKNINIEKIFYYRQIAKKFGNNTKNVGLDLALTMINEISKNGYQAIFCQIIHGPIKNAISINFHTKLGFKCVGEIYDNNYLRGIYCFLIS